MKGTYRHVKRGTTYHLVGLAKLQIDPETLLRITGGASGAIRFHEDAVTICDALEKLSLQNYRAVKDDSLWVRPESEFYDGRFVKVKS